MEFLQTKLENWTREKLSCVCLLRFLEKLEPSNVSTTKRSEFSRKWDKQYHHLSGKKNIILCYPVGIRIPELSSEETFYSSLLACCCVV